MNNNLLVSVIIPSYNQAEFLEETILSVLKQDYENYELIVIDGGSTDNSVEIIKMYEDRIKYWVSEKDEGQTDAIIKGIEKSKGEYFMWLCSDDMIEPSMLSISIYYHKKYPEVGLTYGDRIRIDSKGNIYSMQRFPLHKKWFIKWGFSIPQETTLIKREVYDKTKGLDRTLQMVMDFDLWCKISKISEIYHIPAYLGRFRAHTNNKSSLFTKEYESVGFNGKLTSEYFNVYKKHFNRVPTKCKVSFQKQFEVMAGFIERKGNIYKEETDFINKMHQK